jgi:hypothetical protein
VDAEVVTEGDVARAVGGGVRSGSVVSVGVIREIVGRLLLLLLLALLLKLPLHLLVPALVIIP